MVARSGEFVVIGNTASPAGPISKFTADEWRHFVAGVKQGDFDGIVQDLLSFGVMSRRVARRLINFVPACKPGAHVRPCALRPAGLTGAQCPCWPLTYQVGGSFILLLVNPLRSGYATHRWSIPVRFKVRRI